MRRLSFPRSRSNVIANGKLMYSQPYYHIIMIILLCQTVTVVVTVQQQHTHTHCLRFIKYPHDSLNDDEKRARYERRKLF